MLVVLQSIILGFPGITQNIANTSVSISSLATLTLGLVATIVVLKFGTQLSNAAGDAYKSVRNYTPLLAYFFQIAALWILYTAGKAITAGFFASAPWTYPLIFLALAIIPTVRVVVSVVRALEGHDVQKRSVTRDQF